MVLVRLAKRDGDGCNVLEEGQHFVVSSVIGDEEAQVRIAQNSSDTDKTSAAPRNDTDVLVCVLALPPFAVVFVVERGNGLAEWLDTSCRTVLTTMGTDIYFLRSLETTSDPSVSLEQCLQKLLLLDAVVDFWCSLSKVGPLLRVFRRKSVCFSDFLSEDLPAKPCL